jgi:ribonuclease-3
MPRTAARQTSGDSKTRLELLQGRGESLPSYVLDSAVGEPHEQTFSVRCVVNLANVQQPIEASGIGSSRRRAEQESAAALLRQLGGRLA